MSGISPVSSPTLGIKIETKQNVKTVKPSENIAISVKKDDLSRVGEGILVGSVPGVGILFVGSVIAKNATKMGDGGLGLGLISLAAKPAAAGAIAAGAAAALLAHGSSTKGAEIGAFSGAVVAAGLSFGLTKNPALTVASSIVGGIAGAVSGAGAAYITKK